MYKISDQINEDKNCYKIGCTKDLIRRRIRVQERTNKEKYEQVITRETPFRYLTEKVIHRQLKSKHTPRQYGDGRTEWFTGSKEEFQDIITKVIREVNGLYV